MDTTNINGQYKWQVCVRCMTFNHALYIKDALNGFTMQQTTFPFVSVIMDDSSTDGEQEVIKNYLQEHFDLNDKSVLRNEETDDYTMTFAQHKENKNCFFAIFFLKYNHYSIKKAKKPYMAEWVDNAKYAALCEGDDYWIDSLKLQKQFDFMEKNADCTMICNQTELYSVRRNSLIGRGNLRGPSRFLTPQEIIINGGLFIPTCSILYRPEIVRDYPDYCAQCHVGDYPLQIMAAMKGHVYYLEDTMTVYRVDNSHSWVGRQRKTSYQDRVKGIKSEVRMLEGYAQKFPQYKPFFEERVSYYLNSKIPKKNSEEYADFLGTFHDQFSAQNRYYRLERYFAERGLLFIPRKLRKIIDMMP